MLKANFAILVNDYIDLRREVPHYTAVVYRYLCCAALQRTDRRQRRIYLFRQSRDVL
mgnify:FL=1|jgi:hypothetical protein